TKQTPSPLPVTRYPLPVTRHPLPVHPPNLLPSMHLTRILLTLVVAISAAACARSAESPPPDSTPNPLRLDPQPTTAEITQRDLLPRLYIYADDTMQGRATGTERYARATDYVARELERLGVTPAGDEGSYFQDVPYGSRRVAVQETLTHRGAQII